MIDISVLSWNPKGYGTSDSIGRDQISQHITYNLSWLNLQSHFLLLGTGAGLGFPFDYMRKLGTCLLSCILFIKKNILLSWIDLKQ